MLCKVQRIHYSDHKKLEEIYGTHITDEPDKTVTYHDMPQITSLVIIYQLNIIGKALNGPHQLFQDTFLWELKGENRPTGKRTTLRSTILDNTGRTKPELLEMAKAKKKWDIFSYNCAHEHESFLFCFGLDFGEK